MVLRRALITLMKQQLRPAKAAAATISNVKSERNLIGDRAREREKEEGA